VAALPAGTGTLPDDPGFDEPAVSPDSATPVTAAGWD